jgi:hypothetical protein
MAAQINYFGTVLFRWRNSLEVLPPYNTIRKEIRRAQQYAENSTKGKLRPSHVSTVHLVVNDDLGKSRTYILLLVYCVRHRLPITATLDDRFGLDAYLLSVTAFSLYSVYVLYKAADEGKEKLPRRFLILPFRRRCWYMESNLRSDADVVISHDE